MSILQNSNAISAPAGGGFYDHQISKSFRWTDGAAYLKRTPSSAGNRQTWTFSCWMKASGVNKNADGNVQILGAGTSGHQDTRFRMYFYNSKLSSSSNEANFNSSAGVYRDPSAWYHIVWKLTGGTSYQYVNGTQVSTSSVSGNVAINNNVEHLLGILPNKETISKFKGYMAEVVFIDGTALDPTSFAESKNGAWIAKEIDLTFGSQGYHLDFADASAPGNDVSGNNNDWTNVGLATHDQMLDSPTFGSEGSANFPTINVLDPTITVSAISEGNLKITEGNGLGGKATFAVPLTGKWYWEAYVNNGAYQEMWAGITGITTNSSGEGRGGSSNSNTYGASWSNYSGSNMSIRKYIAGTESAESGSFGPTSDTIIGIAVNRDDNEAKFYKNNALQFTTAISATQEYFPAGGMGGGNDSSTIQVWNFGQSSAFSGNETSQGNADGNGYGDFFYAPPTDFLALCSANLSAAGADPAEEKQPENNYFQALTYTGAGGNGRSLTTKLKAASWWSKPTTASAGTPSRWFNVTGNNFGTGTEVYNAFDFANYGYSESAYQGISNPQDTSITIGDVGYVNRNGYAMVAYLLGVAGASAVTDTSGDIDSVRFTDADAGISIMDYTGSGTNGHTVPHGLGVKPSFVILKNSTINNTESWRVWADAFGDYNDYGVMDTTAAWQTSGGPFTADPTSTMLPLASGATQNGSSQTYQAWVFSNTEGMVKAGKYVGNGSGTNGTFVFTGFEVAFLLIKKTTSNNWRLQDSARDPFNPVYHSLLPNSNAPEDAYTDGTDYNDFLSNGFKLARGGDTANWNASGSTYIYLAFSKMPFKYSTAR